jgi:hypothetical protein
VHADKTGRTGQKNTHFMVSGLRSIGLCQIIVKNPLRKRLSPPPIEPSFG